MIRKKSHKRAFCFLQQKTPALFLPGSSSINQHSAYRNETTLNKQREPGENGTRDTCTPHLRTHRRLCPCPFHTHRRLSPCPFVQKATRGSSQAEQRVARGAALGAQAQMQTAFHQAHMCAFRQLGKKGCSSSGNPGKRPNTSSVQNEQKRATPAQSPAFCSTSKGSRMRGEKTFSLFKACVPAPILSPRFSLRKARQGTGPREAPSTEPFRVQTQTPPGPSLASSELLVKQASWSEVAVLTHNTVFPETCQREAPFLL